MGVRASVVSGIAVCLAAAVATACTGQAGADSGLEASIDSAGGVPRLSYPGEGGILLPWSADTAIKIGDVLGDNDAYQFDRVPRTGVAGDSRGSIHVLDLAGSRILSYDAEGTHRATVGRAGEGPGELANPFGITMGVGDTVWVLDPLNSRITGFPPEPTAEPRVVTFVDIGGFLNSTFAQRAGSFLVQSSPPLRLAGGGEFRIAGGGGARMAVRAMPSGPRGGARSGAAARTMVMPGPGGDSARDNRIPILRVTPEGRSGDTLWRNLPPEVNPMRIGGGGDRVMMLAMPATFTPVLRWAAFADGGIVVSETDRYELNVVGSDGKVRFQLVRTMAPWPVTETEKEHAREQLLRTPMLMGGNVPPEMKQMLEQQAANMTFAETVPRIAGLAVDPQDRIWVGVALTTPGTVDRVDLYDRDGKFLGSLSDVKIPDAFLTNGRAAALVRDPDTDVQQVAVYRILEGGRR